MATADKTKSSAPAKKQKETAIGAPEPKRLSKVGQWMRDNPGGILEYVDWRAVNK
jgi:hypothetical protein